MSIKVLPLIQHQQTASSPLQDNQHSYLPLHIKREITQTFTMKSFAVLASLLVVAFAAPAPAPDTVAVGVPEEIPLPEGWTPISSAEAKRRMTSSAVDERDILKRTPGVVSRPSLISHALVILVRER